MYLNAKYKIINQIFSKKKKKTHATKIPVLFELFLPKFSQYLKKVNILKHYCVKNRK